MSNKVKTLQPTVVRRIGLPSDYPIHREVMTKPITDISICVICHEDKPLNEHMMCKECAEKLAKGERIKEV